MQEPAAGDVGNGGDSGAAPAAIVDAAGATKDEAGGSRKGSSAASDTKGEAREDGVTSQVLHNVENVSHKAMEGAKTFGSFLFSVANKAGKTVTDTATKIKTTVEENVSTLLVVGRCARLGSSKGNSDFQSKVPGLMTGLSIYRSARKTPNRKHRFSA